MKRKTLLFFKIGMFIVLISLLGTCKTQDQLEENNTWDSAKWDEATWK